MILVQLLDNGNVVATFEKSKFEELVEKEQPEFMDEEKFIFSPARGYYLQIIEFSICSYESLHEVL